MVIMWPEAEEGTTSVSVNAIFIIGAPRSGTHLLRFSLSMSPEIWIAPETALMYKVFGGRLTLFGVLSSFYKSKIGIGELISRLVLNNEYDSSICQLVEKKDLLVNRIKSID